MPRSKVFKCTCFASQQVVSFDHTHAPHTHIIWAPNDTRVWHARRTTTYKPHIRRKLNDKCTFCKVSVAATWRKICKNCTIAIDFLGIWVHISVRRACRRVYILSCHQVLTHVHVCVKNSTAGESLGSNMNTWKVFVICRLLCRTNSQFNVRNKFWDAFFLCVCFLRLFVYSSWANAFVMNYDDILFTCINKTFPLHPLCIHSFV